MKHKTSITFILLAMFLVTQFIGLFVVNHYLQDENDLPYGMETPQVEDEGDFYTTMLPSIIFAFMIAIALLFVLMHFKIEFILKAWFFLVVTLALGIALNSIINNFVYSSLIVLILAIPLAWIKIYQQNFFIHNLTELLVYPGIAAVFVPIFNLWTMIILLIIISIYDMWAVWRSGIMQKMAKYQINKLKVFSGFFVPYASKTMKKKIKLWKKTLSKKELKKKQVKINVAVLGGGDVVFPIITAGVMMKIFGSIIPSLFVIFGALLGLGFLMFNGKKKKFYPAMPFITAGIFLGMIIYWLIFII